MKNELRHSVLSVLLLLSVASTGQTIQWAAQQQGQKNLLNLHAGAEHGLVFGASYGRVLKTKLPVVLTAAYALPSGKKLTDDFRVSLGGQIRWGKLGGVYFSSKINSTFKRHQSSYVRLLQAGFDVSSMVGFYQAKWFVAAEAGLDKGLATNFRHTAVFRENYPGVKDGWHGASTGGHLYYGLRGGFSFKKQDVCARAGSLLEQDLRTRPFLPFYLELGTSRRF